MLGKRNPTGAWIPRVRTPISQVAIASTSHSSKLPSISAPRHGYGPPPEASAPVPAARPPRPRRTAPPAAPQGAGGSSTATGTAAGRAMDLKNLVSDELRKVLEEDGPPSCLFLGIFFGWVFSRFYTGNWSRSTGKDNHYHRICLPYNRYRDIEPPIWFNFLYFTQYNLIIEHKV